MAFGVNFGPLPSEKGFDPVRMGWASYDHDEPLLTSQLRALPTAILISLLLWIGWKFATPTRVALLPGSVWKGLALFASMIVVHELVHLVSYPLTRARRGIGFWTKGPSFYAYYLGPVGRNRMILMTVMPFLVLSLAPLMICAAFQIKSSELAFISIWNGMGAMMDYQFARFFLVRFGKYTEIRNDGGVVWWRPVSPPVKPIRA